MKHIETISHLETTIKAEPFALFYLSRPECGVCQVLKPKVGAMCTGISGLTSFYVDLDKDESIAGQYLVFNIPTILVFVDGKEAIRESRHISIHDLEAQLKRLAAMMAD